jgi:hypothetical protein
MNDLHRSFRLGAETLTRNMCKYTELHRSHGIMQTDWELLTQEEHWTPEQTRQVRSILASVIEVCMTIGGLPPVPLPGQYAAAVIAICVAPSNRFLAAARVPDTFDAAAASGLQGKMEIKKCDQEQIMGLVMAYSGGYGGAEPMPRLNEEINEMRKKDNEK